MEQTYKRILVAVDGSDSSEKALNHGIKMANTFNAELFIAHVIDTRAFQTISSYDQATSEKAFVMAKETLVDYQQYAYQQSVKKVTTILRCGLPKKMLAFHIPTDYNIDLMLLGSTNLRGLEKLIMGSISNYVKRHIACDVCIIKK